MKIVNRIGALALAGALCLTACDNDNDDNTPMPTAFERDFMVKASFGNHAEIGAGLLADTTAASDSVAHFGEMMVRDHGNAQADLTVLAAATGTGIPQEPDSMHKAMTRRLAAMSGYMFDTAYMNGQIIDHRNTIALYERALDSARLPAVRNYIERYLPGVRMHFEHAQRIRAALTE